LNDASRINPSFPPLHLARGVLSLFKASAALQSTGRDQVRLDADRTETLRQAGKFFDDALRVSQGKGLMAKLGRARVDYALGKYADALKLYQAVLAASPNLTDPDPRIGIGCCYWQLQFKDDAASAWERSLELVRPHFLAALRYTNRSRIQPPRLR
jgi:RNA polymerase-associated protein CTR9